MSKLFLWFYCLPIADVILLILLATVVFLLLREFFSNTPYWKCGIPVLLLCWMGIVLFATLGQRTEGSNMSEPMLLPFASYYAVLNGGTTEFVRSNLMNAVLFYPAGLLGCEVLPKRWKKIWKSVLITVVFAMVSLGVEYTQYHFGLGQAEADDVIHNALGALLGAIASGMSVKLHK